MPTAISNRHFSRRHRDWVITAAFSLSTIFLAVPARAAGRLSLSGQIPGAASRARRLGSVSRSQVLHLAIGLPLRDPAGLEKLLKDLSDPASSSYHHYLTPADFTERFGPTEEDYKALITFAEANRLTVSGTHPNRTILDVTAPVAEVEKAFHVSMTEFEDAQRGRFYAPDRDPSIEVGLPIQDVSGLDNFVVPRPMNLRTNAVAQTKSLTSGSGPAGLFIGSDFRDAYAPGVTLTGAGQTVGLLEFDGFFAGDVTKNFKQAGLPPVPVQTVLVDGSNGSAGNANIEVILDIMMASYMAPGANKIVVYEGYYPNDILNRMATDNLASQLSSSWVFGPINATTEQIFKQMIAQGQSLFQASGDSGAYSGPIDAPADDPNVTVVGGTSLTTAGSGGPWQSEAAWSGSGGGFSSTYPIPSYQQISAVTAAGGSTTMRNIPDVALTADIQMFLICNNGQQISVGGTSAAAPLWAGFTALANQQAQANHLTPVGFLNPLLYTIGTGANYNLDLHDIANGNDHGYSALPGYDLTTGWGSPAGQNLINDLTSQPSVPAFTLTSSVGTLTVTPGATVSSAITVNAFDGFSSSVSLTVSGLPTGVTATFSPATTTKSSTLSVSASSNATANTKLVTITGVSGSLTVSTIVNVTVQPVATYSISAAPASLSIIQGVTGIATLTVKPNSGSTIKVTLAASGVPSGMTSAFSAVSTSTTSRLTLTPSTSTAPGTYPIVVTAASGSMLSQVTINVTVAGAPGFTLSAASTSLSFLQGAKVTDVLTIATQNGFNLPVSLTASGLPSGVTAAFSPASAMSTSTLTLTATSSAAPATAAITVTGISGSLTSKTTISLQVTAPPSYSVTTSSSNLLLPQGNSTTSTLTITPQNGFSGTVNFALSTLPSGVSASFGPGSSSAATILTLAASSTAALGKSTFTLTGTSGSLTSKTTISLTVSTPSDYTVAASLPTVSALQGTNASDVIAISPLNGFTGSVTLTVSGMPAGVTAVLSPTGSSSTTLVIFNVPTTATSGSSTVTITGVSGNLTRATTIIFLIVAPSLGAQTVNMSASYNVMSSGADGLRFPTLGMDGVGNAYSGDLLGASQTFNGTSFTFGPMILPSAVTGGTITLPTGQFGSLKLLGTAIEGNQLSQKFVVTYVDGTTSSFTQSISDWFTPANYNGESKVLVMPYRDTTTGDRDRRTFTLYEYSFVLSPGKIVRSVTLPNNSHVIVLAMTLTH